MRCWGVEAPSMVLGAGECTRSLWKKREAECRSFFSLVVDLSISCIIHAAEVMLEVIQPHG